MTNKNESITGETSDGYHTFNELYRYRMLYNAAFLNEYAKNHKDEAKHRVGKSLRHDDGEPCFDGKYFIVWFITDDGHVVSNHYELEYWSLFDVPEFESAPYWDGSTPNEEADFLEEWLRKSTMHSDDSDFMETCRIHSIDDFRQKVRECKRSGYLHLGVVRYNNDVIYLMGGNGRIVKIICDFNIYNEDGSIFCFERMKDRLEIIGRVESFLEFYKI